MLVNKLGLAQNSVIVGAQNQSSRQSAQQSFASNDKAVCSPAAADAIKAQNLPAINNYTFLQDVNIPSLNLNGKLYVLPNGQKCLVARKDGPTVIKTFFKVGSMNEPDNLRGISHFIEHNLFNGSKNLLPTEFVTKINSRGASYNASTSFNTTDYYIQSPLHKKDDLEQFIKIHADMLVHPTFPADMIEKERGPVISEIQMLGDNPYNLAMNTALRNLFGIKSTSDDLIGGAVENIKNVSRDDVLNYYKSNYTPKDALTVVIGEVDEKKTMDLLSKNFADFTNEKASQYHEPLSPINAAVRKDLSSSNTQSTIIQLAFKGPNNETNKTAVNALMTALAGYKNAKLSDALRDKTQQVEIQTEALSNKKGDPIALMVSAVTSKNNEEEILRIMYKNIHEMAYIPLTEKELTVVKNKMKMALNHSSESNMSIASILGGNYISKGGFDFIANSEKDIETLTSQDIMNAAKEFLDLKKASIAVVHPKKDNTMSFSGKVKGEPLIYKTPNNAEITVQNIPDAKLYALKFRYVSDEIPPKTSIPAILGCMLQKGTSLTDEKTFLNIEDENNILAFPSSSLGDLSYNYVFPKDSLLMVMDNFNRRVAFPPLSRENFEKAKQELKNLYMSVPKDAEYRAKEALYESTPLSSSLRKTIEELDSVTFDEVQNYYNSVLKNPELKITLSGNLDDKTVFDTIYQNISQNKVSYTNCEMPDMKVKDLTETQVISEAQDRNQADVIQLFRLKQSGNVKDDAAIILMNEILGGNSNSRLFNDLREKQKLAYRVRSSISTDALTKEGILSLYIGTTTDGTDNPNQADNLKKALDGFKFHINKLVNEKVSQEELDAAKLQIRSKLKISLESTQAKNSSLASAMLTPYKTLYEKELLKAIENITVDDIQNIAAYYLSKPSVVSVIASDATIKANEAYLKSLGNYKKY
ncbi:MAG: insulinase family protein [bacterium]|nr:insulinase family protein [bacterium]